MQALKRISDTTRYMQYISALSGTLPVSAAVTYVTWSSPTIPKLVSNDSPIGVPLTSNEVSWVASSFLLGGAFGGTLSWWVINKVGPKAALLLSAIPLFFPWVAIIFAKSAWTICIARFIAGTASSVVNSAAPIYNSEIAENDIRGKLCTTLQLMNILGGLFVLCVGPFTSYTVLAISCSIIPIVFATILLFTPESPYYLIKVKHEEEAFQNLKLLCAKNVENSFLISRLAEVKSIVDYDTRHKLTFLSFITTTEYRKSLLIMLGIKTLQQFSGTNAIAAYEQTIIGSTNSIISPEISSIMFGLVQFPAVLTTAFAVDRYGRKPLLIISGLGCALSLVIEGTYFYLHDVLKIDLGHFSWIPTTAMVIYLVMNTLGMLTVPSILLGELFATNVKSIAISLLSLYAYLLGFLVTKSFDPISNVFGMYTMFWVYAVSCIVGVLFVTYFLPETKGKTFAQIQQKLK